MIITRDMLRTDMPLDKRVNGKANVVLALVADDYYAADGSNSYLPEWQTATAAWYTNNSHLYCGWIELAASGRED